MLVKTLARSFLGLEFAMFCEVESILDYANKDVVFLIHSHSNPVHFPVGGWALENVPETMLLLSSVYVYRVHQ